MLTLYKRVKSLCPLSIEEPDRKLQLFPPSAKKGPTLGGILQLGELQLERVGKSYLSFPYS